jgi:hypothetical protein
MEFLALLITSWIIVWLMGRQKKDRPEAKIRLRNMYDLGSENKVVSAYVDFKNNEYCAVLWLSSINKITTLRAKSKRELEDIVQQTYEESRNPA